MKGPGWCYIPKRDKQDWERWNISAIGWRSADVFQERGQHLKGKPVRLGSANYFNAFYNPQYSPTTLFYCFTDDPEESGILMQDKGFMLYDSVPRYVFPNHAPYFDVTKVGACEGGMYGRICICNGSLFQDLPMNPNFAR